MEFMETEVKRFGYTNHTLEELVDSIIFDNTNHMLVNGLYYCHLVEWLKYFDPQQFLYVDGQLLKDEPWEALSEIELFLGVDHDLGKGRFVRDEETGQYRLKVHNKLGGGKGRPHPVMSDENLKRLKSFYALFNKMFFDTLKHFCSSH